MLNNTENAKRISNCEDTVRKKVKKMLETANLTTEDMITIISDMAATEYGETKAVNYRYSIDAALDLMKRRINEI